MNAECLSPPLSAKDRFLRTYLWMYIAIAMLFGIIGLFGVNYCMEIASALFFLYAVIVTILFVFDKEK